MYKMKPLVVLEAMDIKSPMYGMKNIHSENSSPDISDCNSAARQPLIQEIVSRQAAILAAIAEIRSQMKSIRDHILGSSNLSDSQKRMSRMEVHKSIDLKEIGITEEVVLHASISRPPYSLLVIARLLDGALRPDIKFHLHSTVEDIPADLKEFEKQVLALESPNNGGTRLKIRVVWKDIETCELVISPVKFLTLKGEVNILRFFRRCCVRSTGACCDPTQETLLDERLDLCHSLQFCKGEKEVNSLAEKLCGSGKSTSSSPCWLLGGTEPSLADVAAWSAIRGLKNYKRSGTVQKWMENCRKHLGLPEEKK